MKTLFENDKISVYMNTSDEVFHHNKHSGVTLRIGTINHHTCITGFNNCVPVEPNGCPGLKFPSQKNNLWKLK